MKVLTDQPQRQKTYFRTWAPSKDSDQPAHSHSLIRIFTGRILFYSKDAKFLPVDNADSDTDLSVHWANMSECTFSQVVAFIVLFSVCMPQHVKRSMCEIPDQSEH